MARNVKGSTGIPRNVLTLKESLALNKIIEARYTSSGLNNSEFAHSINSSAPERAQFREDLGQGHIQIAIKAAGLENNVKAKAAVKAKEKVDGASITMILRVQRLEEQMEMLLKFIK